MLAKFSCESRTNRRMFGPSEFVVRLLKIVIPIVAIAILGSMSRSFAWRESHGGDGVAGNFRSVVVGLLAQIEPLTAVTVPAQNRIDRKLFEALQAAERQVRVVSIESLRFKGQVVDAINYPSDVPPLIELSRERVLQMPSYSEAMRRLALHEMLFIAGYDDTDYAISTELVALLANARRGTRTPDQLLRDGWRNCDIDDVRSGLVFEGNVLQRNSLGVPLIAEAVQSGCFETARLAIEFVEDSVPGVSLASRSKVEAIGFFRAAESGMAARAVLFGTLSGGSQSTANTISFLEFLEARGYDLSQVLPWDLAIDMLEYSLLRPIDLAAIGIRPTRFNAPIRNPVLYEAMLKLNSVDTSRRAP